MKNNVLVVADKATGEIMRTRTVTSLNPVTLKKETREVGVVMVQSKSLSGLSALGRVSTRTAFITLESSAIDFLLETGSLQDGKPFPHAGKICIEETLTPYVKKDGNTQDPKINPTTGQIITYQGKPVYRNSFFSEDVNQADVFLKESASVSVTSAEEATE
tara:strand:- start:2680 stop:3162 length:483 start_codon:yes stop_codon:yes gene_type:complete